MANEVQTLSTDIHVITAEINAYQRVAGEAIFEIGKRLKHVRETIFTEVGHLSGKWAEWCDSIGLNITTAKRFIRIYVELEDKRDTWHGLSMRVLYEISTLKEEQREQSHTIPSTGETKTVDEMTVRELREVKAELKKATEKAEQAETARQIADERAELAEQKAQQYEQLFGEQAMYDANTTKVTNGDAVTYAVYSFQEDVRGLVEKYSHLTHFKREFDEMIDEGREEYLKAVETAKQFIGSIERMLTEKDAIIIDHKGGN